MYCARLARVLTAYSSSLYRSAYDEQFLEVFESKELSPSKSANALKAMYRKFMDKDELNPIGARQLIGTMKVKQLHEDAGLPIHKARIASNVDEVIEADWGRYFHSIVPFAVNNYQAEDPQIVVTEIDYMRRVTDLINSTDPRIITNYAYTRYCSSWGCELGERYEGIAQNFYHVMYEREKKAPRWKDCTSTAMYKMKYATGALYVRNALNEASVNVMLEMINDLEDAFHNMVIGNDWVDETTKARALDKGTCFDRSALQILFSTTRSWTIITVRALNYGGIETVIGHEITHEFDDQGTSSFVQFSSDLIFLIWRKLFMRLSKLATTLSLSLSRVFTL
ncbi:unnamed protein product [Angiostrongylus costaricensis]|uniref:Peptidase_M13 domain-containing protein n=1 Tax=Angiostrongylus costaricensis TaxID=334426 RepID=A0A0R3PHH5_ANGCS|nr:unnamed protein product [Angiostrongylus costaricensis]